MDSLHLNIPKFAELKYGFDGVDFYLCSRLPLLKNTRSVYKTNKDRTHES